ncbi:protein NYNRIN-like [Xyrichtys novacula]|uniref:Protein NYNRIN-like n=1 Tax=Xyrichtys novacula TaxID=13765 RepID=A0AAV1GQB6_XYRNO|nr:protein NYNRIN-like [Xyrichtys novacula]
MGRPFPLCLQVPEDSAMNLTCLQEAQQEYVKLLFSFLAKYSQQVINSIPSPSEKPIHSVSPGDYVLVRSLNPTGKDPRYGPAVQVLLTTGTAVKVKGQPQWIHATQLKVAPPAVHPSTAPGSGSATPKPD